MKYEEEALIIKAKCITRTNRNPNEAMNLVNQVRGRVFDETKLPKMRNSMLVKREKPPFSQKGRN